MTIKEMRERQQQLVAEAREALDSITDAMPADQVAEAEARYDKIMAEHDRLQKKIENEERLAAAEAALDAEDRRRAAVLPDTNGENRGADDGEIDDAELFRRYCQFGGEGLTPEQRQRFASMRVSNLPPEMRAQSTSGSAGGYTIPEGFLPEITRTMAMYGPMLDPGVTRMITTASGNDLPWPTMDDTGNEGAILAENSQISEQDVTLGQKTLGAYLYTSKLIRVSYQLLQDSAFNVESDIIVPAFGERIGRIVNRHLTVGTGSSQPNGIVTASSAGKTATTGTTLSFDDLIDLEHSVDPAYRRAPSCRWMFNDSTLKAARKLKDGDGNYLWQPADARTGAPGSILGHPYIVNQAMADIDGSSKPVLFGDMNKYIVRRVREFTMVRLVERYADYLQVGFFAFGRFDGELADTGAVKHLVMQSG
ncbi:MAG: phage major capsid protein [Alphaproteobacteria bacterium]|nr:phage major capsid protein [Alphaproteobacteria bacterium]